MRSGAEPAAKAAAEVLATPPSSVRLMQSEKDRDMQ